MHGYSWGVCRFSCDGALLGRLGRCYPSRAPDAGTLAGTFGGPPEEQVERSIRPRVAASVALIPGFAVVRFPSRRAGKTDRRLGDSFL